MNFLCLSPEALMCFRHGGWYERSCPSYLLWWSISMLWHNALLVGYIQPKFIGHRFCMKFLGMRRDHWLLKTIIGNKLELTRSCVSNYYVVDAFYDRKLSTGTKQGRIYVANEYHTFLESCRLSVWDLGFSTDLSWIDVKPVCFDEN